MATTATPLGQQSSSSSSYFKITKKFIDKLPSMPTLRVQQQAAEPVDLPTHVHTFDQVIANEGYSTLSPELYSTLFELYPKVLDSELSDQGRHNKVYSGLRNLYKCDVYHHGCYFSAPSVGAFRDHLSAEHANQALYCLYCTKLPHDCRQAEVVHATVSQPEQLAEHISTEHANLQFQCNLCLYRGFSAEHVFFHQAAEHLTEFEQSLHRAIRDKLDETGDISPIEREFLVQTNSAAEGKSDDETEVEDNGDDSGVSSGQPKSVPRDVRAKIIYCGDDETGRGEDRQSLVGHFTAHSFDFATQMQSQLLRDFLTESFDLSHCAYCPLAYSTLSPLNYYHHHAYVHPNLPFLAYNLQQVRQDRDIPLIEDVGERFADLSDVDEDTAKDIVSEFREKLDEDSQERSFSDTLMQNAFEYYQNVDLNSDNYVESTTDDELGSISQGVKRKRGGDEGLGADEDEEEEENHEEGDEVDSVSTSETTTDTPPTKRRRLLDHLRLPTISETAVKRTKRVASVVATAAMALGFYHLTHFLPESVQTYLN